MKVLIGLALLSVAYAIPTVPITLPKVPFQPYQVPDMRPMIIPQEVMEAIMAAAPVNAESLVDAVRVVDHAEEVAPLANAAEDVVDPVKFVEVAVNDQYIPIDLTPVDGSASNDAVIVDHFFRFPDMMARGPAVQAEDIAEPSLNEETIMADPVRFVYAPIVKDSQVSLDEESPVIVADAVKFVDAPVLEDSQVSGDQLTVQVVDASMFRKLYDNPLLR